MTLAFVYLTSVRMKAKERQLLQRRQRLARQLPPLEEILRGSVLTRELRCGKPTCHCASGPGHLAHYLTVSFAGGRTEQISLPAALVGQARQWVANYQAWWKLIEAISTINRELIRGRRGTSADRAPRRQRPRVRKRRS